VITARGVIGNDKFLAAQARVLSFVRQFLADLGQYVGLST
jgi:hypothetical protein